MAAAAEEVDGFAPYKELYKAEHPTKLGQGAFGVVFLFPKANKVVKIIKFHRVNRDYNTFMKEVETLTDPALKGIVPNTVYTYGSIEDKKGIIIQEYEPSIELYALLSSDIEINEKLGLALANNLERDVNKVHDAGYLHRDLKPENILVKLDGDGNITDTPILIDFGLARKIPCENSKLEGSPTYLPANIIKGDVEPIYTKGTDNYGLSIILKYLYERISWKSPDKKKEFEDIIYRLRHSVLGNLAAGRVRTKRNKKNNASRKRGRNNRNNNNTKNNRASKKIRGDA